MNYFCFQIVSIYKNYTLFPKYKKNRFCHQNPEVINCIKPLINMKLIAQLRVSVRTQLIAFFLLRGRFDKPPLDFLVERAKTKLGCIVLLIVSRISKRCLVIKRVFLFKAIFFFLFPYTFYKLRLDFFHSLHRLDRCMTLEGRSMGLCYDVKTLK